MKQHEELTEAEKRAACEKTAQMMQSPTFPYVLWFAEKMEAKLEKNRHKGDRDGWQKMPVEDLLECLLDETVEVQQAYTEGDAQKMINECADVANYAMMIADWYLEHSKPPTDEKGQA